MTTMPSMPWPLTICTIVALGSTHGCGRSSNPPPVSCESLDLAAALAKQSLDLAVLQYESARSMSMQERWGPAEISHRKQEGTGKYSSAATRAQATPRSRERDVPEREHGHLAAARANPTRRRRKLEHASHGLNVIDCWIGYTNIVSGDATKRRAALETWRASLSIARSVVNDVVSVCFEGSGKRAREEPFLPTILLPDEPLE